jgi:sugar/nucleoside kinase (ribokinase family)
MLGGFLFFTPGFDALFDTVIDHIDNLPEHKRPTLVLTAAAQSIAGNPAFRTKVMQAFGMTDTVIHANTGEFRRLFDMDTDWRKPFEADFAGLRGKALDQAKDNHPAYKVAKDIANAEALDVALTICEAIATRNARRLAFVVTNGARETFVVDGNGITTTHPNKIERSKIVNTVGAGDNFASGFQLGDIYNLPYTLSTKMGADFATAIIQSPNARLDPNKVTAGPYSLSGAVAHLSADTIQTLNIKPRWQTENVWPWPPESPSP